MTGKELDNYRVANGVSVAEVAREMCVTEGRIRNIAKQEGVWPDTEKRYLEAIEKAATRKAVAA